MDAYDKHRLYNILDALDVIEWYIGSDFQPCEEGAEAYHHTSMLKDLRYKTWQIIESDNTK